MLTRKVAIVTGAARGIGRAYALHLAAAGATVVITDKDLRSYRDWAGEAAQMTAETVVDEIVAAGGVAAGYEVDGTDAAGMNDVVEAVLARFGRVDVLVNNAGGGVYSAGNDTAASTAPIDDLRANVERNVVTAVVGCQAVLPTMRSVRSGSIINVATQAAVLPMHPMYVMYAAAKSAVVTYSTYLADEVGADNIRVNVIAPGYIETARVSSAWENGTESIVRDIALRRVGTPDDCAEVVTFLAGDGSAYVSGQVIGVAGGPHVFGSHRYA